MRLRWLLLLAGLVLAPGARAEPLRLDPGLVLGLAAEGWRGAAGFSAALESVLGAVARDAVALPEDLVRRDPFLWSLPGRFALAEAGGPGGGLVICARYGLATRDLLAGRALSDPALFPLVAAAMPRRDDARAWPEGAVARLSCLVTWDDPAQVGALAEAEARAVLAARFAEVRRHDAAAAAPGGEQFHLGARGGADSQVVILESAEIARRPTHHLIRFRAYLMGGGM